MNQPDSLLRYPFPSRRSALLCSEGIVATSQPLAAQAGLRMLQEGGNAVDAALACAVALTVVEPVSNGIGSDAFALVWDGERLHGLNASGRAPAGLDAEALRASHDTFPEWGWSGVTVPGAPDAWRVLHARFAKLDLERIMAPAIAYAETGFPVSPMVSRAWAEAALQYPAIPLPELAGWEQVFAPPRGRSRGRRGLGQPRPRGRASPARGARPARFLRGRDREPDPRLRRGDRGPFPGRRSRVSPQRMGRPDLHRLPWPRSVGDPAERTGHRRAPGARNARWSARTGLPGREMAPADGGDEARVRRYLPLRRRSGGGGGAAVRAARCGLSLRPARPHRGQGPGGPRPAHPLAAAPCTSARWTATD